MMHIIELVSAELRGYSADPGAQCKARTINYVFLPGCRNGGLRANTL